MDAGNENSRMIARIDAAYSSLTDEDERVLSFIRARLQPEAIAARDDEDKSVRHLHDVAKSRLKPYEKQEDSA